MDLLKLYYTTNLGTMVDEGLFDAYILYIMRHALLDAYFSYKSHRILFDKLLNFT